MNLRYFAAVCNQSAEDSTKNIELEEAIKIKNGNERYL